MALSLRRRRLEAVPPPVPPTADPSVEPVLCEVDASALGAETVRDAIAQCKDSGAELVLVWSSASTPEAVNEIQVALIGAVRSAREAGVAVRVAPPS